MQVLWSRAAQTRSSCRCSACHHAATAIARRTTSATSRRRLKIGDLFTACYGTILGTAAFADAKAKEERRKQWDRAIEEVKAEVPMGDPGKLQWTVPEKVLAQGLHWAADPIFHDKMGFKQLAMQNSDVNVSLDLHVRESPKNSSKKDTVSQSLELGGESPDEENANFTAREPATPLHVEKMEQMISNLVTRLLARRRETSALVRLSTHRRDIPLQLNEIAVRLESLRKSNTQLPSYTFHDPQKVIHERFLLNNAIEGLFGKIAEDFSNLDLILAKICYNLLISSSPPSVQTYDILMRCLTRLRLHELAQVVVDSFLFESRFMPTSTTIQLILNHYSVQKDLVGFRATVARLRATCGDMRIKRRRIDSLDNPKVQQWALTSKVIQKGGYLKEKVFRNSHIFDSLINGFLELDKLTSAIRYFRAALRERVQISSKTLCRIVCACTEFVDYEAGLDVLRALLEQWEGDACSTIEYTGQARFAVRRLLSMCQIDLSLEPTQPLPFNVRRAALVNLQLHISISSMEEIIYQFSARTKSVEALLAGAKDVVVRARIKCINKALTIFQQASDTENSRSRKKEVCIGMDARFKKASIGDNGWLLIQNRKLSTEWKRKYRLLIRGNPGLPWADRIESLPIYQKGKNINSEGYFHEKITRRPSIPWEPSARAAADKDIIDWDPINIGILKDHPLHSRTGRQLRQRIKERHNEATLSGSLIQEKVNSDENLLLPSPSKTGKQQSRPRKTAPMVHPSKGHNTKVEWQPMNQGESNVGRKSMQQESPIKQEKAKLQLRIHRNSHPNVLDLAGTPPNLALEYPLPPTHANAVVEAHV